LFIVLRKRTVALFCSGILFLGLSLGTMQFAMHPSMKKWQAENIVISKVNTTKKVVALTFDDGPDPLTTPAVLDALKKNNVKATFFVLGAKVEKSPQLAQRIVAEEHEIGGHGYAHADYNRHDIEYIHNDINKTNQIIFQTCKIYPLLFRPPGGYLSEDMVDLIKKEKLTIAYWTYQTDSKDWKAGVSANKIAGHIINNIDPGQIIILHDGGGNALQTAKALNIFIPILKEQGYQFVTVSELISMNEQH
jgi:peptidoglycan/xylan/chitin deacetylase (PgdA/CDA1 family)